MRKFLTMITGVALTVGLSSSLAAAPCKDAKGKFTKCPPAAAAKAKRCKGANGKFAKCGTPGAKPM